MEPVDVTFRSDFTVDLVQHEGGDRSVLKAMLISTGKDDTVDTMSDEAMVGRLRFLMKNRHGTPFEHNSMTFRVEAPIFVLREWHRHRIGVSINEQSGRYRELPPMFYVPPGRRPLTQIGKPGEYQYTAAPGEVFLEADDVITKASRDAYAEYLRLLELGVAREVARIVLPVNIYSSMYWTCNARSLMSFLSLRVDDPGATHPSKPMWEIDQCARMLEKKFGELFPVTADLFNEHGRVSP